MNPIEQIKQELTSKGKAIFALSSGNANEFGINYPQGILDLAYQAYSKDSIYKPDPKGYLEARQAVKLFYQERGISYSEDQIILTSGTSESYFHLFKLLCLKDERILFPNPSYPLFSEIATMADIQLMQYLLAPEKGWQIDLVDLECKIRSGVRAIVLISPSNPTGAVLSKETVIEVIKLAKKYRLPIISDEVFSEFIFTDLPYPSIAQLASEIAPEITVYTLNGVSKTYALPGLKISWIVVSGKRTFENVDYLERPVDAFLSCNQIGQKMLPTIIKNGQPFIDCFKKRLLDSRDVALSTLGEDSNLEFHIPEGGFYLFCKIKNIEFDDEAFVIGLMKETGIFVHPGYYYDYEQGVNVLISLLPHKDVLLDKLKAFVSYQKSLRK